MWIWGDSSVYKQSPLLGFEGTVQCTNSPYPESFILRFQAWVVTNSIRTVIYLHGWWNQWSFVELRFWLMEVQLIISETLYRHTCINAAESVSQVATCQISSCPCNLMHMHHHSVFTYVITLFFPQKDAYLIQCTRWLIFTEWITCSVFLFIFIIQYMVPCHFYYPLFKSCSEYKLLNFF